MLKFKHIFTLLLFVGMMGIPSTISSQLTKEQKKERQELYKTSKKALEQKATKIARKEAKKLSKQGWSVVPGALPIEKQLDRSYLMQMEYDADLFPAYIMAEGMSVGGNYDAAKVQAIELAKLNLATQIETEITALIENSVANKQLEADEAATLVETVAAGKTLISQNLGRLIPVVELYRTLPNHNKEVLVRLAYSQEMARKAAIKAITTKLEDKANGLHEKLDRIIGGN